MYVVCNLGSHTISIDFLPHAFSNLNRNFPNQNAIFTLAISTTSVCPSWPPKCMCVRFQSKCCNVTLLQLLSQIARVCVCVCVFKNSFFANHRYLNNVTLLQLLSVWRRLRTLRREEKKGSAALRVNRTINFIGALKGK